MMRNGRKSLVRYGIATAGVLVALAVRFSLSPFLGLSIPHAFFVIAVILIARYQGRGPALLATALSLFLAEWFFMAPRHSLTVASRTDVLGLVSASGIYLLASIAVGELRESHLGSIRAEAKLCEQAKLIELSRDAVITADANRVITSWNAGAQQMYGWTEEEAVGKVIHRLLKTSSRISVEEIDAQLRQYAQWEGELTHTVKDGRLVVVESRQVLAPGGLLEISRDITERKRAEEDLRTSEGRFRMLANAMPQLCWMANPEGWVFWYNQRWHDYTGKTLEQAEGSGWTSVVDPAVVPELMERWKHSLETGKTFEMTVPIRGVEGVAGAFLTRAVPLRDARGDITRWFGTCTDISEQRRTEEELRRTSEQRGLALEAASLGTWEYFPGSAELILAEQCRAMLGLTTSQRPDYETILERIHPDDRPGISQAAATALNRASGEAYQKEFRVIWPDGSVHWIASHGRGVADELAQPERPSRFIGVTMDITHRRRAEEALLRKQKLETIGALAGGIAHDFNNLLMVIVGRAMALRQEHPYLRHIEPILNAAEEATILTRQLLAYAGKGVFVKNVVIDVSELVSQSREIIRLAAPKNVSVRFDLSKRALFTEGDPKRLEQVLMNLVVNAGEAISGDCGGHIEISTSAAGISPETALLKSTEYEIEPGEYVCLEVRDDGQGMDHATMARVFDPFFSTKFVGRGLGLSAVHGIVRAMKGVVEIESEPGKGSIFRVLLPAAGANGPSDAAVESLYDVSLEHESRNAH